MILIGVILRGLARLLFRLLFLLLLISVLAKGAAFAAALWAEHHPQAVLQLASRLAGVPITARRIRTDWHGFTPRLWLEGLEVGGRQPLELGDVGVRLCLSALPWWRHNLPVEIRLQGTRLRVIREADGRTRIQGLLAGRGLTAPPALLEVRDATVEWIDRRRNARLTRPHLTLRLLSRGAWGRLQLHDPHRTLEIRAEIQGRLSSPHWSARLWARGQRLRVDPLLQPYLPPTLQLARAEVDFQLWSQWWEGRHQSTRLLLEAGETRLQPEQGPAVVMERLGADLLFQRQGEGWRLQVAGLRLQSAGDVVWPAADLALSDDGHSHRLAVSELDLAAARPYARLFPLPVGLQSALEQARPGGHLRHLRLQHDRSGHWSLTTRFERLEAAPWRRLPGVAGLDGTLSAGPGRLHLALDSRQTRLELPRLFREPLYLSRLQGDLDWHTTEHGGWRLDAPVLQAHNPDLETVTRLHIEGRPGQPLWLDLQSDFGNGDGSRAARYYPVGIMKPNLVAWLEQAIRFGQVTEGRFLLVGPADHFPFHRTHDGHFEVRFQARKARIDYRNGWPPLTDARATVRFHNNRLTIRGDRARILHSRATAFSVRLPSLKPLSPLQIRAQIQGPLEDELRILRETPLASSLAHHVEGLELRGRGALQMKLHLPLHQPARSHFQGTLHLQDATLEIPARALTLDDLEGRLQIDPTGVHGEALQARVLGGPVTLSLETRPQASRITAEGKVPVTALLDRWPALQALSPGGTLPYRLELWLARDAGTLQRLQLDSTLQGVTLDLPPPLGKAASARRPLKIETRLNTWPHQLHLDAGPSLQLDLSQPRHGGARVALHLERLPLRAWLQHRWPRLEGAQEFELDQVQLNVNHLEACPLEAHHLELQARRVQDRWRGTVNSDRLTGRFHHNAQPHPGQLELALDRLWLSRCPEEPPTRPESTPPDPRRLPALKLTARDFRIHQARLGRLELATRTAREGQILERLVLDGALVRLQANGAWFRAGRSQYTHLQGHLTTDDAGRFLRQALALDFLDGSKAYFSFDLHWPGAPYRFDLKQLEGRLQLDMTAGRFLNLKPGAGRILGLLNLRAIGRRLKFDFKDVYERGLAFDTLLGSFQLDNGVVYTNDLEISSPSATIRLSGNSDLIHRTHDQVVTLSPHLDATLPVAGAIVGGPVTGLAVLVAQQALSGKLEKMQQIHYTITGSWEDPKVTPQHPTPAAAEGLDLIEAP